MQKERAVLAGTDPATLAELGRLADTAGAEIVGQLTQKRLKPDPKYFIGSGKLEELKALAAANQADLVVFDAPLTPSQERNLEDALGLKVVNRTELIIDIFAQHARSREGKLQVELAQSNFRLTRLTGHGVQMSRLGGGIATRGPGETKLEYDRRRIKKRISELNREIDKVRRERSLRRAKRRLSHLQLVALVGYTNSGKSTLLNTLSRADVLTADKLFATLDPTTRRLRLSSGLNILLTDTVGFIRHLPHQLVTAFRATLEEVSEADLLLHVVDISQPDFEGQIAAVFTVLEELNCAVKPMITVFNKLDCLGKDPEKKLLEKYRPAVAISAYYGTGLDKLEELLVKSLSQPPEQPPATAA
ncbi:MAG: GTPase HflX [Candidatus Margulisbacteria bacterium]|nr:GTPase HflX [Candidatus Margulisiibacteriota bacterium]